IHLLNTFLVFIFLYRLSRFEAKTAQPSTNLKPQTSNLKPVPSNFKPFWIGAIAALLFGIHPMHVESVAWISERKDVLYCLFFLSACITYWRYLERQAWPWLLATFALFVLSCLSKGMAVVFPVVMALLDFWKRRPALEPE